MSDDLNDRELIRQMAAYIAGMDGDEPSDDVDDQSDAEIQLRELREELDEWQVKAARYQLELESERATVARLNTNSNRLAEQFSKLRTELGEHREAKYRAEQELARARSEELEAQRRIVEALGQFDGRWVDEAVERLTRRREMTLENVAAQMAAAAGMFGGDTEKVAAHMVAYLGITLRASTDRPASPIDTERGSDP